jgi:hypothetical protein
VRVEARAPLPCSGGGARGTAGMRRGSGVPPAGGRGQSTVAGRPIDGESQVSSMAPRARSPGVHPSARVGTAACVGGGFGGVREAEDGGGPAAVAVDAMGGVAG